MASPFAQIDQVAMAAVDDVMGEALCFLPRLEGRYSVGSADPNRARFEAMALVTEDHGLARTDGEQKQNFGFELLAGSIRISVARSVFAGSFRWLPQKGDRLQAIEREGQPMFEVSQVLPDNTSRIVFICVRVKA